jgi:hypothetical protein
MRRFLSLRSTLRAARATSKPLSFGEVEDHDVGCELQELLEPLLAVGGLCHEKASRVQLH